jgi:hypothetical protein
MIPNSELLIVEDKNHRTISEPAVEDGFKWLRGFFYSILSEKREIGLA